MDQYQLQALIVDDEADARDNLSYLVKEHCRHIRIADVAGDVAEAARLIAHTKPDFLFLDISMPLADGFSLLQMIDYTPPIVFVTAHEQYALRALKASAVDFILKPVAISDLLHAEEKLLQLHSWLHQPEARERYSEVLRHFTRLLRTEDMLESIAVPDQQGYSMLDVQDILYLEGRNNYTLFHTNRKQKFVVSKTLKEYEDLLSESNFLRIHKSSIINLRHLRGYNTRSLEVVMSDEKVLPVSRRRAAGFLTKAKNFLV
jgi:two-component system LytT family response regulator